MMPLVRSAVPAHWSVDDIPSQGGRLIVITGANAGLGLIEATRLAACGGHVLMACRDMARGKHAQNDIRSAYPHAQVEVEQLDLADLRSVRAFAERIVSRGDSVDLLINNGGVMGGPRRTTADGFEMQFGTNHLGHFALTGLLLPALVTAARPRVVTVSSTLHANGRIDTGDLNQERRYRSFTAYAGSKLSNLLFAFEFDRRLRAAGVGLTSVAAHPGYSATNLQLASARPGLVRAMTAGINRMLATPPATGAVPILCAATLVNLPGGSFVGPGRLGGYRGSPALVQASDRARDETMARHLWQASEQLTGVSYELT